jgi:hypothetical protein
VLLVTLAVLPTGDGLDMGAIAIVGNDRGDDRVILLEPELESISFFITATLIEYAVINRVKQGPMLRYNDRLVQLRKNRMLKK